MRLSALSFALAAFVFVGCDGAAGTDLDTDVEDFIDEDEDGVAIPDDCDDNDKDRFPGNTEVCDGKDNDCNDQVDDDAAGANIWYADLDGDKFGNANSFVVICSAIQPPNTTTNGEDCDDLNEAANPFEIEVCDGADNNCNDQVDEGAPLGSVDWYEDKDADGYGAGTKYTACEAPDVGWVDQGGDCNDNVKAINPGAEEDCATPSDDDCSSIPNDPGAIGCKTFYLDLDGDSVGSDKNQCTCTGLGSYDATETGDCNDSDKDVYPGRAEVCSDSIDQDCALGDLVCPLVPADQANVTWIGEAANNSAGLAMDAGLDLNDDFLPDLLFGAPNDTSTALEPGFVYFVSGPPNGENDLVDATVTFTGFKDGDWFGFSVDASPDVTGDGLPDVLIGATKADRVTPAALNNGAVYVFAGPVDVDKYAMEADATILGEVAGDLFGSQVGYAGDWNDDGVGDIYVAARAHKVGSAASTGAVYVFFGPITGTLEAKDADAKFVGEASNDTAGWSVANVGDLNDDGLDDLAIGAPANDAGGSNAGAVYLVHGGTTGTNNLADAPVKLVGNEASDSFGGSISGAHDTNDDGFSEFLVGACDENTLGTGAGAAYLFTADGLADGKASTALATIYAELPDSDVGCSVAGLGDVNDDGYADMLFGAPGKGAWATEAGAAFLLPGPISGDTSLSLSARKFTGEAKADQFGRVAISAGDLNIDGLGDYLLGAPANQSGGVKAGKIYLFFGDF